jgi:hypothetical protein
MRHVEISADESSYGVNLERIMLDTILYQIDSNDIPLFFSYTYGHLVSKDEQ